MNTIELIKAIERRPGMYVDSDSLQSLVSFIRGYYFARSQSGVIDEYDRLFSEKFYPWLKDKYSLPGAASWGDLILEIASMQNLGTLDAFFREFHDFLKNSGVR
ncbi:uncharacterized protein sS8_3603 [Methylocaldum marinum]|uniref:Uncharacterized protein n=1 Tax=Methylocaldum marinum TaxID=1432792 RepID=A0A250KV69_9GAMM|nr:hypothetical protein [Methylocaldum marinum]BBA35540.1 uncharacterized protein sS8_3603 [Methylocaldum marinum]